LIKSFKHAGLEKFFKTGSKAGINPAHAKRLGFQLNKLNEAETVFDMDLPGFGLHQLKGNLYPRWSISVDRLWRLTFEFANGNATVIDYEDYHTG
jgi:proteic killer suppression protein